MRKLIIVIVIVLAASPASAAESAPVDTAALVPLGDSVAPADTYVLALRERFRARRACKAVLAHKKRAFLAISAKEQELLLRAILTPISPSGLATK